MNISKTSLLLVVSAMTMVACHDDNQCMDNGNQTTDDAGPVATSDVGPGTSDAGATPSGMSVQLGPRPYFLVEDMESSPLREQLLACGDGPFQPSHFSIGHRGAPLQFPEHSRESYTAAARMGAGIIECDVTFTKDRQLVCRHSQCDLHTTTNILAIPELAAQCTQNFVPADPVAGTPASAQCCTSDITLAQFRTLCAKMDGANPAATTVEEYMAGTADFRTDLYSECGTLMTHAESIALIDGFGRDFTPELKAPAVMMPFEGDYTQEMYARQMIQEYVAAGIDPSRVWAQSFNLEDVTFWLRDSPEFGRQAVYLDDDVDTDVAAAIAALPGVAAAGVQIVAPPMWALLTLDSGNQIIPSEYATTAKANGLDIITWTLERSGRLRNTTNYYFQGIEAGIERDGDTMVVLDVLARQVGVLGVFSDWPATTTYYANCMGL